MLRDHPPSPHPDSHGAGSRRAAGLAQESAAQLVDACGAVMSVCRPDHPLRQLHRALGCTVANYSRGNCGQIGCRVSHRAIIRTAAGAATLSRHAGRASTAAQKPTASRQQGNKFAQLTDVRLEFVASDSHDFDASTLWNLEPSPMKNRNPIDLLRRLRLLPIAKDKPVNVPYPMFVELLHAAIENDVDEIWYTNRYPDVAQAIKQGFFTSAAHHYAMSGMMEGRMPFPIEIDEADYLARHVDVAKAIKAGKLSSATEHFYLAGFVEGRAFRPLASAE
ncbi:MAG: hypothetical protein KF887_13195 [Paracoccaceae bacterium]|nr:MAG: hypothetical protein KF887_13195 [Paracoccaceae bacterium]